MLKRLLHCFSLAFCVISFASAQEVTNRGYLSPDVRALLDKLQNASVRELNGWAKDPASMGALADRFCLARERFILLDLVATSLAARNASTAQVKKAVEAQRAWDTYLLMTFQPIERQHLIQLLDAVDQDFNSSSPMPDVLVLIVPATKEARDAQRELLAAPVPEFIELPPEAGKCHVASTGGSEVPSALWRSSNIVQWSSNVKVVIGTDGSVLHAEKGAEGNAAWDKAAIETARHWKWRPFYVAGLPVKVHTSLFINFQRTR